MCHCRKTRSSMCRYRKIRCRRTFEVPLPSTSHSPRSHCPTTQLVEVPLPEVPLPEVPLPEVPLPDVPLPDDPLDDVPLPEDPLLDVPLPPDDPLELPLPEPVLEVPPLEPLCGGVNGMVPPPHPTRATIANTKTHILSIENPFNRE